MTAKVPTIVVIGGSYIDIAVKCGDFPTPGHPVSGTALSYNVTGPGPCEAVEAALCGCRVYLISKVGGDPFASRVRSVLAEHKVNNDYVFIAEAKNTGTFITMVNSSGENSSLAYTGANSALQPQDIELADQVISQADICLIHGKLPEDAIRTAINLAKVHGKKVILNPARPLAAAGEQRKELPLEYFAADIFIPNLYEAAEITEHSAANIRAAKLIGSDLVARGVGTVVITMGRRGCMIVDRQNAEHILSFEVELVDHAGTGDAFAGALAACYGAQENIREAVKFASAAGALACTKFGGIESLPTKADIIELLQKQDLV
jgi:ribokinase